METTVKIDKKAKYIVIYADSQINILLGHNLLGLDLEGEGLTSEDQIFKLGEEYKIETKLVKVNNKK